MQRPTCTDVRIRSIHDAHKIFFAIQKHRLFMVTRRLDVDERLALRSGCVYAWEERGPHTEITGLGIERFTEGRRWSPSRVRDDFLFYYEKYSPPQDATQTSNTEKQPPRDWDPLVKQTYSVWVDTDKGRRKWHLTAYFTQATVDQMGTIDDIPDVKDLEVPEGLFQSTRAGKNRKTDDAPGRTSSEASRLFTTSTVTRGYAPFSSSSHSISTSRRAVASPALQVYQPFQSVECTHVFPQPDYHLPSLAPESSLPPIRNSYYESQPRVMASAHHMGSYGRHDVCERQSPLEHAPSHSSLVPRMAEHLPPAYSTPAPYLPQGSPPAHTLLSNHTTYPSCKDDNHPSSAHPRYVWYAPHSMQEASANHPSTPTEIPTSSPLPSSSTDQGQVSPSCSYPHMYSYLSDPNTDPLTHSNMHSHSQSQPLTHVQSQAHSFSPASSPDSLTSRTLPAHSRPSFSSHPYAASSPSSSDSCSYDIGRRRASLGPSRVDLAPLHALQRNHPYRRDPVDDRALRLLGGLHD